MLVLVVALACGSAPSSITTPAPANAEPAAAPASTPSAEAHAAAPAFDPLAGHSLAEICRDRGLSLIKWDYDQLQRDFAKLCCGPDGIAGDIACDLDWPFSDVPPCHAYDELRNHIFARYGYPFRSAEWQETFGTQPWYQRRDDFDPSWLSEAAKRNVERLKQLKASQTACAG
ncbi:MAG: YARHG domain-containing protein [Deltaproteobacteria bacterium]|nr:MAG: YARHG domain-containing protein [Deltaproteobacteria bacterium]